MANDQAATDFIDWLEGPEYHMPNIDWQAAVWQFHSYQINPDDCKLPDHPVTIMIGFTP